MTNLDEAGPVRKLWLLEAIEDRGVWDIHVGFVIRAASEAEARAIAQAEADEFEWQQAPGYWTDICRASCVQVDGDGDAGVILADFKAG